MPSTFREKYKSQLPKHHAWSWSTILNYGGSAASIYSIYLYFQVDDDDKYKLGFTYLTLIIVILLVYILLRESSKRHRYAQAVYHIHFVNHTVRDFLAGIRTRKQDQFSTVLNEIVDAISSCFSLIEGRQCRCTIKEISKEDRPQVITMARDHISRISPSSNTDNYKHYIDNNTDFDNIYYGKVGCLRYFRGQNLRELWRQGEYKNSSFQVYNEPKRHFFLGYPWVSNWNLPYNSTMVWPIRFIPDYSCWPPAVCTPDKQDCAMQPPHFWGFLCVDTNTSKAFSSQQAAELGALFADSLYTMFGQMALADLLPGETLGATTAPAAPVPEQAAAVTVEAPAAKMAPAAPTASPTTKVQKQNSGGQKRRPRVQTQPSNGDMDGNQ